MAGDSIISSPLRAEDTNIQLVIERVLELDDTDMEALCEAATAAIIEGGGFGWMTPPGHPALRRWFNGILLVPEHTLLVARLNGRIVGSAQLVRPSRHNEAQAFSATLMRAFVAPYARGYGLARMLTERVEEMARAMGAHVLNLDVRETQEAAITLYESMGYQRWGEHPAYALVNGRIVRGFYYCKILDARSGRRLEAAK